MQAGIGVYLLLLCLLLCVGTRSFFYPTLVTIELSLSLHLLIIETLGVLIHIQKCYKHTKNMILIYAEEVNVDWMYMY